MKKTLALILTLVMCLSLGACGGGEAKSANEIAYDISKSAYDNVQTAYEITEQFASDIYEAWRLGIYEDDEIKSGGCAYLADKLGLSEDELRDGVAYLILCEYTDENWDEISETEKADARSQADIYFYAFEDSFFSFCVQIVVGTYKANGKVNKAQTALDEAKSQMKELSAKHSDYEHYPSLKSYFTTTSSFLEFCLEPTGSFEQVKTTINDYKNEARDYISDLDYIFEE